MEKSNGSFFNPVFLGVFFVAMATLCLEVLLTRVFSFSIWYHFAYLTINFALLGFGSSGAVLAGFPALLHNNRWQQLLTISALISGITIVASFLVLARYPLQPDIMFKFPMRFSIILMVYYVSISIPFFFAGMAIAASMAVFSRRISHLYFWDLCGAATGCLLALLLLNSIGAPGGVLLCAFMMSVAACFFSALFSKKICWALAAASLVLLCGIPVVKDSITVIPSRSKTLARVHTQPDTYKPVFSAWNAINRVDVYKNVLKTDDPFWKIGTSAVYTGGFPDFYDMQYDAHNGSNIFNFKGDLDEFRFLDYHVLKTPYIVLDKPNVLIIGVGGGIDIYNALKNNAASITAVELQPIAVNLLKNVFAEWVGDIYTTRDNIRLIAGEGRNFVNSTEETFDLIQITVTDTFAALNTGAYVLMESYLYTEEAYAAYFDRLNEHGILCIMAGDHLLQGSTQYPPMTTRLILQYINMLAAKGITAPEGHLAILAQKNYDGSIGTVPLLKKTPFTSDDIMKLREFADAMGFFLAYNPLAPADSEMLLARIISASGEERANLIRSIPYNVSPSTDNNPFFYNFILWKTVYEVLNKRMFDFRTPVFGQAILLLLLVQSIVISFFFIVLPLLLSKKTQFCWDASLGYLIYFACLGLGFMFMEISFIQKYVLFLGYPAHAFAITLFSLLLFVGIGSYLTGSITQQPERTIRMLIIMLPLVLISYTMFLGPLFDLFLGYSFSVKVGITIASQMPLGLLLGMFFPLGIKTLNSVNPRMVPWAWGANGMCSVVSTILAIVIAMSFGFKVVSYLAIAIYIIGTISYFMARAVHTRPSSAENPSNTPS